MTPAGTRTQALRRADISALPATSESPLIETFRNSRPSPVPRCAEGGLSFAAKRGLHRFLGRRHRWNLQFDLADLLSTTFFKPPVTAADLRMVEQLKDLDLASPNGAVVLLDESLESTCSARHRYFRRMARFNRAILKIIFGTLNRSRCYATPWAV
jgi:hypothetical protein